MLKLFKDLFKAAPKADYKELYKNGALILDVRTKAEYQNGHIKGSQNIPLNNLSNHYARFKKDQVIITCCASGNRSGQAKRILEANGFTKVYNGGGWMSLQSKIK